MDGGGRTGDEPDLLVQLCNAVGVRGGVGHRGLSAAAVLAAKDLGRNHGLLIEGSSSVPEMGARHRWASDLQS